MVIHALVSTRTVSFSIKVPTASSPPLRVPPTANRRRLRHKFGHARVWNAHSLHLHDGFEGTLGVEVPHAWH